MHENIQFYGDHWMKQDLDVFKKSWYIFLEKLLSGTFDKTILEIGCGSGTFSHWLSKNRNSTIGTDIVASGIKRTIANNAGLKENIISYSVADAQNLSFKDDSFDVVVMAEVLEHIPVPAHALTEVRRILKPNGRMLITIPNLTSIRSVMKWTIGRRNPRGFSIQPVDHIFTIISIRRLIEKCGFRIMDVFGDDFFKPFVKAKDVNNSKFLQLLYKSWENQRPMKYFGKSLILDSESTKMLDDRNLDEK